jgi:hypothetical protein
MKRGKDGFLPVIRLLMMPLPGVSESVCYGTPAFYVSKKLLVRMKEDGETLVVYTPDRDEWTSRDNVTFFITDHYKNYPYVLVNLVKVERAALSALLAEAWRSRAGKKLLQQGGRL